MTPLLSHLFFFFKLHLQTVSETPPAEDPGGKEKEGKMGYVWWDIILAFLPVYSASFSDSFSGILVSSLSGLSVSVPLRSPWSLHPGGSISVPAASFCPPSHPHLTLLLLSFGNKTPPPRTQAAAGMGLMSDAGPPESGPHGGIMCPSLGPSLGPVSVNNSLRRKAGLHL